MAITKKTATYRPVDRVEVHLWGHFMGVVALDPAFGFYAFRYTPQFLAAGLDPSPLHMSVKEDRTFLFTDLPLATYKGLPAMLSDALPDDFGNALINRYMAERGYQASDVTPLDRLAYMSNRAMGALQFKPARGPAKHKPTAIELGSLVVEARKALTGTIASDEQANAALRSIIEVGTSAGGARAKAVISWNPSTQVILSGQIDAPPGFEHWLLKFDGMGKDQELGSTQDYGRIEYAYYLMAQRAGITMAPCQLLQENGRAHFMTQRFDRGPNNTRHHMQTLCAMAHLDYKKKGVNAYAQLFATMRQLQLPYEDMSQAFRRMAFNVMARNCDDHTKNMSFRMRQGHAWELAPAYDITFAHNPKGEWTSQHLMSVNGKFKDFERADLQAEATRFGLGHAGRIMDEVYEAVSQWLAFAQQAGVSEGQAQSIQSQLNLL